MKIEYISNFGSGQDPKEITKNLKIIPLRVLQFIQKFSSILIPDFFQPVAVADTQIFEINSNQTNQHNSYSHKS
jgi:hypothetical protein